MRPGLAIIKAKFCDLMMEKYFQVFLLKVQLSQVEECQLSVFAICTLLKVGLKRSKIFTQCRPPRRVQAMLTLLSYC